MRLSASPRTLRNRQQFQRGFEFWLLFFELRLPEEGDEDALGKREGAMDRFGDIVAGRREDFAAERFSEFERPSSSLPRIGDDCPGSRRDGGVERLEDAEFRLLEFPFVERPFADLVERFLEGGDRF